MAIRVSRRPVLLAGDGGRNLWHQTMKRLPRGTGLGCGSGARRRRTGRRKHGRRRGRHLLVFQRYGTSFVSHRLPADRRDRYHTTGISNGPKFSEARFAPEPGKYRLSKKLVHQMPGPCRRSSSATPSKGTSWGTCCSNCALHWLGVAPLS